MISAICFVFSIYNLRIQISDKIQPIRGILFWIYYFKKNQILQQDKILLLLRVACCFRQDKNF